MVRSNAYNLEKHMCNETLRLINQHHRLNGLPVVVVTEAAPGIEASYIVNHIDKYARQAAMRIFYIRELKNNDIGVLKNKDSSELYRYCLEFALEYRILAYSNELMTVNPDATPRQELDRFGEMCRSYHFDEKTNVITSKTPGMPDDILAALNQLLYWIGVFWKSPKYAYFRQELIAKSGHYYPWPLAGVYDRRKLGT